MAYKIDPGIYLIHDKENNRNYIGSTNCIQRRWIEHKSALSRKTHGNSYLQYAWDKYGESNFEFKILERCPIDQLEDREQKWRNNCFASKRI